MKFFNSPVILIAIFTVTTACTTKPSKEAREFQTLFDEVIVIHDEVMPQMGKLNTLGQQLKKEADTTTAAYTEAAEGLKKSHKVMMDWMKDFSEKFPYDDAPLKDKTPEEITQKIALLKSEKEEMSELRDLVNQSIEKAERLLEKK
ncbi:hypothetical protein [Sinomicrobium weinanense]|uniref:Viral A-type inclusion protein n=1 Tax=Sinomicrobium weinanense TaxID=2842200 RepID=A0A926JQ97_9FLAO|nr:hypothetical protein [Sinomicrobium weinanense]MBC9795497.1 hypothetical protein [Sinomicrobium weinanense]MBU3123356.1 hypothetical protein [Sinomicrobium weinanense]